MFSHTSQVYSLSQMRLPTSAHHNHDPSDHFSSYPGYSFGGHGQQNYDTLYPLGQYHVQRLNNMFAHKKNDRNALIAGCQSSRTRSSESAKDLDLHHLLIFLPLFCFYSSISSISFSKICAYWHFKSRVSFKYGADTAKCHWHPLVTLEYFLFSTWIE